MEEKEIYQTIKEQEIKLRQLAMQQTETQNSIKEIKNSYLNPDIVKESLKDLLLKA